MKRIEKAIWFAVIPGIAAGYLLNRLLRPAPEVRGLMGQEKPARKAPAQAAPGQTATDDLEMIVGIGPVYGRRLRTAGVRTFADLAATSPDRLLEIVQSSPGLADPDSWRAQAAELMRRQV